MRFPRNVALSIAIVFTVVLARAQSNAGALSLTFTTIDVPGAVITNILGINTSGEMVGNYSAVSSSPSHGFLYSGGAFTFFDYPEADSTIPHGINDSGLISGCAGLGGGTSIVGFTYNGTFTTITAPGKADTDAWGIDSAGDIVGGAGTTLSSTKAFELKGSPFKNISLPGTYLYAYRAGVNNLGEVVGFILNGSDSSGFVYKNGKSQSLVFPGPTVMTLALGLNDRGIIVGWYEGCSPACADHGFVIMKGKYFSFDFPGAIATFADGINASGQIVGSYTLDGSAFHGYVTNPIAASAQ
jgi:hypothetical protein